jgi:ankyrin repeat protein
MDGKKILRDIVIGSLFLGNCFLEAEQTSDEVMDSKEFELSLAASEGNKKLVKALIEEGANVNTRLYDGQTALHEAALYGSIATMRILLANGADPNLQDDEGNSPLHLAMYCGSVKRAALLLDHDANPNAGNNKSHTPLMCLVDAIINQAKAEKIKPLLKSKKSLSLRYPWNRTNNFNCYYDMIRLLVNRGARINEQDNDGNTALHLAVSSFGKSVQKKYLKKHLNLRLVKELVNYGTDVNIRNHKGETALDLVQKQKEEFSGDDEAPIDEYDQIIEFLLEHSAVE